MGCVLTISGGRVPARLVHRVDWNPGRGTGTCGLGFAFSWRGATASEQLLAVVNYAGNQGQCYVRLPFPELVGRAARFSDLMSPASYDREGSDILSRGLYLDLPPWGYHVFEVRST